MEVILERSFNLSEQSLKEFLEASLEDIKNVGEDQLFQQITPFSKDDLCSPELFESILENIKESYKQFLEPEDVNSIELEYNEKEQQMVMTFTKEVAEKLYKRSLEDFNREELSKEIMNSSEEVVDSMEVKWRIVSAI